MIGMLSRHKKVLSNLGQKALRQIQRSQVGQYINGGAAQAYDKG